MWCTAAFGRRSSIGSTYSNAQGTAKSQVNTPVEISLLEQMTQLSRSYHTKTGSENWHNRHLRRQLGAFVLSNWGLQKDKDRGLVLRADP